MLKPDEVVLLYQEGLSSTQVALRLGFSRTYCHKLLHERGLCRSRSDAARLRKPAISNHWRSKRVAARNVWEREIGPIPSGYHIHHRNKDYTDNSLSNLQCLSAVEHAHIHRPVNPVPRHLRPERKAYNKIYHAAYWKRKQEQNVKAKFL
jgi:hypothetical protein